MPEGDETQEKNVVSLKDVNGKVLSYTTLDGLN
jgi:hypothetical protein